MPFQTQDDTLTYERHFGLNEKPFSLAPDPRFVYDSPAYRAACAALLAGIRRREGLLVLTGEIGTGKTTLCRAVLRDLGRRTYGSLVPDPFASREDLLKMLLIDFGVLSITELTAGHLRGASRTTLGYLLSEFLDSLAPEAFVVAIIDEAQNLSLPLIEEMRLLSDTYGAKGRLQLLLVGQPELQAKLKLPEMRQVDQRVCGYHHLGPLDREAVAGYVQHRLQAAGGQPDRVLFPPDVVDALHQRSGGVPRLVNRVCDRALHLAYERQAQDVDRKTVEAALVEIGSTTLLPTWDSIVFAGPPTPPPVTVAATAPVPTVASVARASDPTPSTDLENAFKSEIAGWIDQDLAPPSRTPSPPNLGDDIPRSTRRPVKNIARPSDYGVEHDWQPDLRFETYIQRLRRVWGRRVATAAALVAVLYVAMVGGSLLLGVAAAPIPPAPVETPARAVPGIALPEMPLEDAPSSIATVPPPPAAGEYLVAVGLFASSERADQLVDALTEAGLPAMQRALRFRQQPVQQIVLGPFLTRSDAVADLRRLQALGGYDDARVVASSR